MQKIFVFLSIVLLGLSSEPQPVLKDKYYLYVPEIRHKYSIISQKINEQLQKQKIKISTQKLPNPTFPTPPLPAPQPQQSQRTQKIQMTQQKSINNFNQRTTQPITISLPATPKPIQIPKGGIIPRKKIQFDDIQTQVPLRQKKSYKIYNINDQSVLDLDGNIASVQLLETKIKQKKQNLLESLAQVIKIKSKIPQEKINIKEIIYEKKQKKQYERQQKNNLKKQPTNQIKIQQQTSNQTSNSWLVIGIFILSAFLILYGYKTEENNNQLSLNSRDDQQINLR